MFAERLDKEKWTRFFGGVVSAVLLLPIPAFATIANFNWGTFSYNDSNSNPFASYSTSPAGSSVGVLYLTPPAQTWTMNGGDTWSITATFDVTGTPSYLGGAWTNLNMINSMSSTGDINIKVVQSGNSTSNPNMFGSSGTDYTTAPLPAAPQQLTTTNTGAGGFTGPLPVNTGYTITVTISFPGSAMQFGTISSTPIALTLQEVSAPPP